MTRLTPQPAREGGAWVPIGGQQVTVRQWHGARQRSLRCYMGVARKGRETERCGHTHFHIKRARLCATTLANRLNHMDRLSRA